MPLSDNDIISKFQMTFRDLGTPDGKQAIQVIMEGIRSTVLPFINDSVNHGITDIAPTNVYYNISLENPGSGGAQLLGLSSAETGMNLKGISTTVDTTTTPTSSGAVRLTASKKNGTTDQPLGATENAFIFRNQNNTIGIVKGNGDFHSDGTFISNGFDFAEYFISEELVSIGSPVGIDIETGNTREYREGDILIGICSDTAGFLGNAKENVEYFGYPEKEYAKKIIVGLIGQFQIDDKKFVIENRLVKTKDNKYIVGYILSNNRLFLSIQKI